MEHRNIFTQLKSMFVGLVAMTAAFGATAAVVEKGATSKLNYQYLQRQQVCKGGQASELCSSIKASSDVSDRFVVRANLSLRGVEHLLVESSEDYRLCRTDVRGSEKTISCQTLDSPVLRGVEIVGLVTNARATKNTLIVRYTASDTVGLSKSTCQPATSKLISEIRTAAKELSKRRTNKLVASGLDVATDSQTQVTSVEEAITPDRLATPFRKDGDDEDLEGITVVAPPYEEPNEPESYDPWLDIELQYILAELEQLQNDPYAAGSESCKKGCDATYKLLSNGCARIFHPAARAVCWGAAAATYAACLAGC